MPTYSFYCDEGHETDRFCRSRDDRPQVIHCGECGGQARHRPSVVVHKTPQAERVRVSDENWSGVAWHKFVCGEGHDSVLEVDFNEGQSTSDTRECEVCAGPATVRFTTRIDRFSEMFPYFDNGLGCMVHNKADRVEKARRRGLVPLDGDVSPDAFYRKEDSEREHDLREYDSYAQRVDDHPGYRNYREQRDRGAFDDDGRDPNARFTPNAGAG